MEQKISLKEFIWNDKIATILIPSNYIGGYVGTTQWWFHAVVKGLKSEETLKEFLIINYDGLIVLRLLNLFKKYKQVVKNEHSLRNQRRLETN